MNLNDLARLILSEDPLQTSLSHYPEQVVPHAGLGGGGGSRG